MTNNSSGEGETFDVTKRAWNLSGGGGVVSITLGRSDQNEPMHSFHLRKQGRLTPTICFSLGQTKQALLMDTFFAFTRHQM